MSASLDVAVVGAGPAGSLAATRLARAGYSVHLFEEHGRVGEPRHCTGILSREAFDRFPELPREVIQSELHDAWIIGPSGAGIRTSWFAGQAFVMQRTRFDQLLSDQAVAAGAVLHSGESVVSVVPSNGGMVLQTPQRCLEAQAVIVASGASYRIHRQLELKPPAVLLQCAQTEVTARDLRGVEVYIGHGVAPGSFAWAVPLGNGQARIGVTAHGHAAEALDRLLQKGVADGRWLPADSPVIKRPVPIRMMPRSAGDRVLFVGDAAGQVKPTTAGGIYYGLIGAELAAQRLDEGFRAARLDAAFLMEYDRRWKKQLGPEIRLAITGRFLFERFSDQRLDRLVEVCRGEAVRAKIQRLARFDWHGRSVWAFLADPRVLAQLVF